MTVHLAEGSDFYARLMHGDQETAQPLMLRDIDVGAHEQYAIVRMVG